MGGTDGRAVRTIRGRSGVASKIMRTTTRIMAVLFAGVVVLAACGGDDDDAQDAAGVADGSDDQAGNGDAGDGSADGKDDGDRGGDEGDVPDPCELVTREDAQALFGDDFEAQRSEDAAPIDIGEACLWENVGGDELGNPQHLLQVRVYDGEQFYGEDVFDDAEPIDIGERGFVSGGDGLAGVDVQFVKGGLVFTANYVIINIGVEGDTADAASKRDAVVELARQAADRM